LRRLDSRAEPQMLAGLLGKPIRLGDVGGEITLVLSGDLLANAADVVHAGFLRAARFFVRGHNSSLRHLIISSA
jgi:hypothetical protein